MVLGLRKHLSAAELPPIGEYYVNLLRNSNVGCDLAKSFIQASRHLLILINRVIKFEAFSQLLITFFVFKSRGPLADRYFRKPSKKLSLRPNFRLDLQTHLQSRNAQLPLLAR